MSLKNLKVIFESDTTGFQKGLKTVQGGISKMKGGFSSLTKGGLGFMGKSSLAIAGVTAAIAGLVAISSPLEKAYVGLESSINRVNGLFGIASKQITNFSENTADAFGMSESSAYQFSAIYGNLFRNITRDSSENANVTIAMLKASAVVASKTGRTIEDVMERIRSGLLGNTEAIEDLGIYAQVGMLETTNAFKKIANGRSWEKLNFLEQQQIRTLSILEQAHTQFGDTVQQGSAFSLSVLSGAFKNLQATAGAFVNNALAPIVSWLTEVVRWANAGLKSLAAMLGVNVKGNTSKIATNLNTGATGANNLASGLGSAEKEAKKLKRELAGFDKFNDITKDIDSANGAGASGAGAPSVFSGISQSDDIVTEPKNTANSFKYYNIAPDIKGLADSFKMLGDSVSYLWNEAGLKEFVRFLAESVVVAGIRLLSGAFEMLAGAIDIASGMILWIKGLLSGDLTTAAEGGKKTMEGLGKIIEGVFVILLGRDAVNSIKDFIKNWGINISTWWSEDVAPWFTTKRWAQLWTDVKTSWSNGWTNISTWWNTSTLVKWWQSDVSPWFTAKQWVTAWDNAKIGWNNGWTNISTWWSNGGISKWWDDKVAPWFTWNQWNGVWSNAKLGFSNGWDNIVTWWKNNAMSVWFDEHVKKWFTWEQWRSIWDGLKANFEQGFKNAINGAIDIINRFIKWLNDRLSFSWDALTIAGKQIYGAGSIKIANIQEIKHLAKGGIAYGEVQALVGDNFNARQNPEVIAPLSTLKGMIVEALMQKEIATGGNGETRIILQLENGETLADMLIDPMNKKAKNMGYAPVFKPA